MRGATMTLADDIKAELAGVCQTRADNWGHRALPTNVGVACSDAIRCHTFSPALQAKIEGMERDCTRYQWLRDVGNAIFRSIRWRIGTCTTESDADKEIDAAIKEQSNG